MNALKYEKMYKIIREQVLNKYMGKLAQIKPAQKDISKRRKQLFEVYEYVDSNNVQFDIDYDEVEQQIKKQITRQFNEYLCEAQTADLQMEIFLLDKEIQTQLNQIELLQNKIKNYHPNIQIENNLHYINRTSVTINNHHQQKYPNQTVDLKQTIRETNKMCLVPNFRLEVLPKQTIHQNLDKTMQQYDQLKELLTKDIELRNKQAKNTLQQTIKIYQRQVQNKEKKSKDHHMNDLIITQRTILQCKQNWMSLKHEHKKAKQAKKKLKEKIAQFWQQAEAYQNI